MCLSPKKKKGTALLSSILSWSISISGHLKPQVCVHLFVFVSVYIGSFFNEKSALQIADLVNSDKSRDLGS